MEPSARAATSRNSAGVAAILRERKHEFDAWLVLEAGKTWAEADADVSEAIDFCGYYARQALKLAHPESLIQLWANATS